MCLTFHDFQIFTHGGVGAKRTLESQPDPSPNVSRDQIRCILPLLQYGLVSAGGAGIILRLWTFEHDDNDSSWSSSVKYAEHKAQVTISMSGWGLEDGDMEERRQLVQEHATVVGGAIRYERVHSSVRP